MLRLKLQKSAALTLSVVGGVVFAALFYRSVSRYGARGTLRLLWEGDHLTPELRDAIDILDYLESTQLPKAGERVEDIEADVQAAILNAVDGGDEDTAAVKRLQESRVTVSGAVKTKLSTCSYDLDAFAAKIDAVRTYGNCEIGERKKRLSTVVVELMERVDAVIGRLEVDGS